MPCLKQLARPSPVSVCSPWMVSSGYLKETEPVCGTLKWWNWMLLTKFPATGITAAARLPTFPSLVRTTCPSLFISLSYLIIFIGFVSSSSWFPKEPRVPANCRVHWLWYMLQKFSYQTKWLQCLCCVRLHWGQCTCLSYLIFLCCNRDVFMYTQLLQFLFYLNSCFIF